MELNQLQNGFLQKQRLVVNITTGLKNVNSHIIILLRYCKMTDASFRAVHPEKLVVNFNKNLESSGKYRDSFYSEATHKGCRRESVQCMNVYSWGAMPARFVMAKHIEGW